MGDRFRLQVKTHFDAAHHLDGYPGKCARVHGHRWDVEVVIEGFKLGSLNMLIDFTVVKKVLKELIDELLDHYDLNESLQVDLPTAEYLAKWFFDRFDTRLKVETGDCKDIWLSRTCIWESPECCVKYYRTKGDNGKS